MMWLYLSVSRALETQTGVKHQDYRVREQRRRQRSQSHRERGVIPKGVMLMWSLPISSRAADSNYSGFKSTPKGTKDED